MDGTRFDDLVRRLALARLTRSAAVRGVAGGALAGLSGAVIADDEAEAKKKSKNRGGRNKGTASIEKKKKKKICHCPDGNPLNCKTKKVSKKARKKHLRNHQFDTPGKCPEPVLCTNNSQCAPQVCISGVCQRCTNSTQCDAPQVCNTATGNCQAPVTTTTTADLTTTTTADLTTTTTADLTTTTTM